MCLDSKRIDSLHKQFDQIGKEVIIESGNYILRNSKGLRIVKCVFPQCSDDKHHFGMHSKDLGLLPLSWGSINLVPTDSLFCLVNFVKSLPFLLCTLLPGAAERSLPFLCLLLMPKLKAWSSNPNISFQHLPYEEFQVCHWELIPSKTVVKTCHLQHGFCFGFCASSKNHLIVFQEKE